MLRTDQHSPKEGAPILVRRPPNRASGRLTGVILADRGNNFPRQRGRYGRKNYRSLCTAQWGDGVERGPAKHELKRGIIEPHDTEVDA